MLSDDYKNQIKLITKINLFDELEKCFDFEVPMGLYEVEYKNIKNETQRDKDFMELANQEAPEIIEAYYSRITNRRVRIGLFIKKFAAEKNISVSNEDIYQEIEKQINAMPGHEKQLIDFYKKNQYAVQAIANSVLEAKVISAIDMLIKKINKNITSEELDLMMEKANQQSRSFK
jgi:trigger factor